MKKAQENPQDSRDQNINFFKISLSLMILMTSVTFLVESVL